MPEARTRKSRSRKKKHPVRDRAVYVCIRFLAVVFYILPARVTLGIACACGRLLWRLHKDGRQRALDHLRAAYPDKDDAWRQRTARRSFEHIAMLGVDVILTPHLAQKKNWQTYGVYKNVERTKWLMQEGRGVILVTGHYGNFEILGYLLALFGFQLYSVARPLDNPYLDRYIRNIRERHGQTILDKKGAAQLMSHLGDQRASLGMIADQDAGWKGLFVDFFGRPASTFKSIAVMAAAYDMPVAVGYSRRIGNDYRFEIGIQRLIFPSEWADKKDPIVWIAREYTRAIEAFVREDPSQYWWVHRRWKTRPKTNSKRSKEVESINPRDA